MRIAVDIMGGDYGPRVAVQGAVSAAREYKVGVLLVGAEDIIKKELRSVSNGQEDVTIVNASESIGMGEGLLSFRKKSRSSILVGLNLVKGKKADAFVSIGNTGAVVYLSRKELGALKGVERPALALLVPTLEGMTLLTDVGANANCSASHLVQFALMGEVFMKAVMGIDNPRIALMSIGEEKNKGNDLTREVNKKLSATSLNFIGNVEGKDIYSGKADVIVSDGFTGNIALKTSEGVISNFAHMARLEIMKNIFVKIGFFLMKRHLKKVYKKMDYAEYGGAYLLGVNGVCIVGHGRSNPVAIKNAVRLARDYVKGRVQEKILERLDAYEKALIGAKA
ncbi:MAG: phosphate acyltransferase PlsX [Candidatus Aminicenantes bacterium]|nr:phosphate acyltransferase PlsX [Candidatus Aminicenantes bacterium]